MKKYLFAVLSLVVGIVSATSWQKVDLQYIQTINGKNYTADVTLLKPESYYIAQHVSKSGDKLNVDLSEMGLGMVTMAIVKLTPYKGITIKDTNGKTSYQQVDEINWEGKTNRPAIATYKTWAQIVNTYSFIDSSTGQTSKINTTPGHRFYVANKHDYISIKDITPSDTLIDQNGQSIKLICPDYATNHECGERYNKDGKPTAVYNFEVYQLHRYYVADKTKQQQLAAILVHNILPEGCGGINMDNPINQALGEMNENALTAFTFKEKYPKLSGMINQQQISMGVGFDLTQPAENYQLYFFRNGGNDGPTMYSMITHPEEWNLSDKSIYERFTHNLNLNPAGRNHVGFVIHEPLSNTSTWLGFANTSKKSGYKLTLLAEIGTSHLPQRIGDLYKLEKSSNILNRMEFAASQASELRPTYNAATMNCIHGAGWCINGGKSLFNKSVDK